jgi:uncharacterized protein (TIGR02266 family)
MTDPKNLRPRSRRLPIQLQITQSTLPVFLDSEIMNLSKGGVFIRSDIALPLGSEIDFQFTIPGSNRTVSAVGVVVWSRKAGKGSEQVFPEHLPGMGVAFKNIDVEDLDLMLDEIERIMQNP